MKLLFSLLKKYKRIHQFVDVLSFFTNKDWEYENGNIMALWEKMSSQDKKLFNFDMSTINWNEYFKHYIKGIRVYLFKDELNNVQTARIRYQRYFYFILSLQ